MSRYFLSRFLALSNTDENEAIDDETSKNDDETSKDVNDDETAETLCDRRTRVRRRVLRLFFCCCYSDHFLSQKL